MIPPSWRAALRIARRDALRARGRSTLIVAMIALPVLALTVGSVIYRTYMLDPNEQANRQLGTADAAYERLDYASTGAAVVQSPDGTRARLANPPSRGATAEAPGRPSGQSPTDPPAGIPSGSRTIVDRSTQAMVRAGDSLYRAEFRELAYTDPLAEGIIEQRAGRAPESPDEVSVTTRLRDALDLTIGDTIRVTLSGTPGDSGEQPAQEFTVVGIVADREMAFTQEVVAPPGSLLEGKSQRAHSTTWLADTPTPVSWQGVTEANQEGTVVVSRAVLADPPPRSDIPLYQRTAQDRTGAARAIGLSVVVFGMATLEVLLLAGAAFAVGARRQQHQLALMAATGGEARHVRRVVLGGGVVLGLAGALSGIALGIALAAVGVPLIRLWGVAGLPGHFDLRPLELAGVAAFGGITGLLAALVPARGAAKQDVVAALTGRRGTVRTKRRYPIAGFVLVLLGGGCAALGVTQDSGVGVTAGALLTQIGLVVASPAIVGFAGRLGRLLPATPRVALRDASRNRSRSAPAMASIMAAVAGACALSMVIVSQADRGERQYERQTQHGDAILRLDSAAGAIDPGSRTALREAVVSELPVADTTVVKGPDSGCSTPGEPCSVRFLLPPEQRCSLESMQGPMTQQRMERCNMGGRRSFGVVVGDAATLRALAGVSSPTATRTLSRGGAVLFDERLVTDGQATAELHMGGGQERTKTATISAASVQAADTAPRAILSPEAMRDLGFEGERVQALAFDIARMPTTEEEAGANAALQDLYGQARLYVERGYEPQFGLTVLALVLASAVVTLGASGIATGLALADSRTDQATLGAVGGSPRIRRFFAACQAGTISWLGAVLGTLAGFVPGIAIVWADPEMRIVVPWVPLAGLLLVLPLLPMLAAFVFTRSRTVVPRRIA